MAQAAETITENVTVLHPFSDEQALAWLRERGRISASNAALARQWGWHHQRVTGRLRAWAADGLIRRRGKAISTTEFAPIVTPLVKDAGTGSVALASARKDTSSALAKTASVVLAATAIGLAAVGLAVNAKFAASLGTTAQAAFLLAAIGIAIDTLAVILPTVSAELWRQQHRGGAVLSWTIWSIALVMMLLATTGFASTNIGDTLAGRSKDAALSGGLAERLARERAERAAITETRPVAGIESAVIAARPLDVWKQTLGCTDVTLATSATACAEVLRLRSALGSATRRDEIDAAILRDEAALTRSPVVSIDDPGATIAAQWTGLSVATVQQVRIAGLTVMPALSGLLMMLALTLWGRRLA